MNIFTKVFTIYTSLVKTLFYTSNIENTLYCIYTLNYVTCMFVVLHFLSIYCGHALCKVGTTKNI